MANIMRLGGGSGGGVKGKKLSELTEGSLVSVLEDGKLVPFCVAKHNYESDLNGEGRTLLVRKDLLPVRQMNSSNANAYAASTMDAWLNGDYKAMLSAEVQGNLGATAFEYTVGGGNASKTTLQRSVFILSLYELGLTSSISNNEGETLPVASLLKTAYLNGVVAGQWTRTPSKNDSQNYLYSYSSGSMSTLVATSTAASPRPCFTLPANMALNTEPYADGSWGLADEDVLLDTSTASTTAKSGVTYTNGIADLTPAQLHEIAAAISANPNITKDHSVVYYDKDNVHRKISTGDRANMTYSGVSYAVNIIGFNHDDLIWGLAYNMPTVTGKAGMTFQTVDSTSTGKMNPSATNSGGWASSDMRNNYMVGFYNALSAELKSVVKVVNKLTANGANTSTITATEDKLFLLSEMEIFGIPHLSADGEGSQYAYYKAGNSAIKTLTSGASSSWWTRSPHKTNSQYFRSVDGSTGGTSTHSATTALGIAFAYCI